ncbi:MAG TPA: ABC transporter ATP-binding protein [Isosphaeraceae bacterium]|jgi:ABC-type multidrug transport system fused ATPase/permease subunit|nr:ABC transporter ATP-binding protein [Isosphaeraceae bacterium]
MKNFARLVRFAWPYRVRFGLSLACAAMVALLGFSELGAVYPLLHILFNSQNCRKWVAEQVDAAGADVAAIAARCAEVDEVVALADPNDKRPRRLVEHKDRVRDAAEQADRAVRRLEDRLDEPGLKGPNRPLAADAQAQLAALRRTRQVAEARLAELRIALALLEVDDHAGIDHRRAVLDKDLDRSRWWEWGYRRARPFVERHLPADSFQTLLLLLGLVMLGVAVKGLFLFLQEVLVANVMQLSLFSIRNLFFRRTMALDLGRFTDQGSAELMARFTNDMDSFSQGLNTLLSKMVREPLRVATCLGGALWLNWRMTCLALVLVPVSAVTTYRAGQIMKRAVRRALESMSNIYKILQECFQGIKVVKAFTMERRERRRFFLETKRLYKKSVKVAMIDALSDPVLEMLALSTVSIALLAGSYLVLRRTTFLDLGLFRLQLASQPMMIEDLLTLYAMLAGISDPIRKLANVHSKIQRAAAASDRICALMDRCPEVAEKSGAVRLPRHHRTIEFDRVGFSYNGRDPVLRGLELTVRHGETIALVGPNGCGKSTLMNLLPRFWDVHEGAIRVDGHDLRDLQLRSLRAQIGMVTQETVLFEGTIAANIAYGSPHAGPAAVEAASRRAYAHQFIAALPEGYDTVVGERGMSLSGGQRQRIALARAMLRDPAILILDEATSAVDIQDEALIRRAIEEFVRGRTTFLITHNLGSLQFADRIVLMDAGRIVAAGTDAELRRCSPLYRRLHEIHFQRESA